jgi:hypothetical protein
MDINGGLLQIAVAEENLDGAQIGAGLQQMGGKAVTQGMRMKRFANAGAFGGFATGVPTDPCADRMIGGMPLAQETTMWPVCGLAGDNVVAVRRADGG